MSREIEFRAWDKKQKGYILGFNLINFHSYWNKGIEPSIQRYEKYWKLSEIVIEQYTGLKDKNGKKIFEGDIISCDFWNPKNYKVEFIDGGFCFTGFNFHACPNEINMIEDSKGIHFTITGTIHDA